MRGMRRPSVVCTLGSDADLFHVAKTVTGLCRLEAQGRVNLTLRHSSAIGQHAIVLEWDGTTAGIDLSDHSDRMMPKLSNCDLYFKRCVRPEDLKPGGRIRPFGLNYACRSTRATLRLLDVLRSDRCDTPSRRMEKVSLRSFVHGVRAQTSPNSIAHDTLSGPALEPGGVPGRRKRERREGEVATGASERVQGAACGRVSADLVCKATSRRIVDGPPFPTISICSLGARTSDFHRFQGALRVAGFQDRGGVCRISMPGFRAHDGVSVGGCATRPVSQYRGMYCNLQRLFLSSWRGEPVAKSSMGVLPNRCGTGRAHGEAAWVDTIAWPLSVAGSVASGIHGGIDGIEDFGALYQIEFPGEMRSRCQDAGNVFHPQSLRIVPALAPVSVAQIVF